MKTFFVVSALRPDSNHLGVLVKHGTEGEAISAARNLIIKRQREGLAYIDFHVLKVVAHIGSPQPSIKVTKVK